MVRTGQATVTAAGTAVQLDADERIWTLWLRAHPDNTGDVFIGDDGTGDVASTSGLALKSTDPPLTLTGRLSDFWVDAETNGDKLCWMVVSMG